MVFMVSIKSMVRYIIIIMYIKGRLIGYVLCRIYTYVIAVSRLWSMLLLRFVVNFTMLTTFRVLSMGLLPITYIFMKKRCSIVLLYVLIVIAIFVMITI